MRCSVSSRIREISAFDQSRMPAMSSSAWRRRSAASVAESVWIASMWVLASAANFSSVSVRAPSAAVCIALARSAISLFGLRPACVARGSGLAGTSAGATGATSGVSVAAVVASIMSGLSVSWLSVESAPVWVGAVSLASATVAASADDSSVSGGSWLQGSRNPVLVSVVAIRMDPR